MAFGLTMTLALGIKAPLNFSVFSAAGGSLLLSTRPTFPVSVDELRRPAGCAALWRFNGSPDAKGGLMLAKRKPWDYGETW